jgi:hypothetical protein
MAPVPPVLHRLSCSKEMVRNVPKYGFWVQWSRSGAFVAKNANATLFNVLGRLAPVRLVLHRVSCSNETVRNDPKHEFWIQWSESGVFVAKISNATSFTELVR